MESNPGLKRTARSAGFIYMLLVFTAPFAMMYVPSKIIVKGDAAATAANLAANENLFRAGIAAALVSDVIFLLLAYKLYQLFEEVNRHRARLMAAFAVVSIPVGVILCAFNLAALSVAKGDLLHSFDQAQTNDLVMLMLKIDSYSSQALQLYWGIWLLPFAWLIRHSGFIPKILGVLLALNGIAYLVLCMVFVLLPGMKSTVYGFIFPLLFLGELPVMLWLLIKGVKKNPAVR